VPGAYFDWKDVIAVSRLWRVALCLAAGLLAAGPTHAQTLTAAQILQQFNAVVFGNFSTSSDVDGRTVIGGNLTGSGSYNTSPSSNDGTSTYAALSVYGASNGGGSINIDNGGGVTVAGLNTATLTLNGGNSVYIGSTNSGNISDSSGTSSISVNGNNSATITDNSGNGTIKINGKSGNISGQTSTNVYLPNTGDKNGNINNATVHYGTVSLTNPLGSTSISTTFKTPLTNLSTQLEAQASNSTVTSSSGTVTFNAAPNSRGQAIFNINSSVLTAGNENVVFDANGATTIIINVTCGSTNCSITLPSSTDFLNDTSYAADTIWNFYNASTLDFGAEFGGTVLAPNAAVANSSPIDGDLIANSFSGTGELHNYPFVGNLTFGVPEPASIAMLGVGLIGLLAARRRAQRRTSAQPATTGDAQAV
jgi:choice-of-anchor A domain-containing protein